ncbi:hypothetical protein ANCDUO_08550 [Ancylostoma duodenale]|uniref:Peptidase M12A domain-containing protein n=1 Tax=Ancylostoma duodenale TaxID=51022 RepID=A0A0C2CW80_9BILA|nr:hypothetical protein ANCDUO_08550 [Ancylostoma duodenale]
MESYVVITAFLNIERKTTKNVVPCHMTRVHMSTKMRLAFSVLLLTMCISAFRWPEYGANALHERNGHVGDEMNTLFEKILNITNAFKVHKALAMLHAKIGKTLELSEEMMTSLYQRLKRLRPITHVQVNRMGDTITEINERSKIADFLFQGDIILTDEQIEDIKEDVEEETSGMGRWKRQAYKDWKYPNTIWSKGVNYHFDYSANHPFKGDKVRSVFRKAAKEWERDTCIDIRENSKGGLRTESECSVKMDVGRT